MRHGVLEESQNRRPLPLYRGGTRIPPGVWWCPVDAWSGGRPGGGAAADDGTRRAGRSLVPHERGALPPDARPPHRNDEGPDGKACPVLRRSEPMTGIEPACPAWEARRGVVSGCDHARLQWLWWCLFGAFWMVVGHDWARGQGEPPIRSGAGEPAGVVGSRVAVGHRVATRSALDAARRRAKSGAKGRWRRQRAVCLRHDGEMLSGESWTCAFCRRSTEDDPRAVQIDLSWAHTSMTQSLGAHNACLVAAMPGFPLAVEGPLE